MDSHKKPSLEETTHGDHHILPSTSISQDFKKPLYPQVNHTRPVLENTHEDIFKIKKPQEPIFSMDTHRNPNLENPSSSQDFKKILHHQVNDARSVSNKTQEEFFIKNAQDHEPIFSMDAHKNPNLETTQKLYMPSTSSQGFKKTHDDPARPILKNTHEEHFSIKNTQEPIFSMDAYENPNLETIHNQDIIPSTSSKDFKKTHDDQVNQAQPILKETHEEFFIMNTEESFEDYQVFQRTSSLLAATPPAPPPPPPPPPPQESTKMVVVEEEESGRERLKRHRVEMAGRVWIPDIWGQEDLLKDWIDCSMFDSSLGNRNIMSARAALIQEGRSTLSIENSNPKGLAYRMRLGHMCLNKPCDPGSSPDMCYQTLGPPPGPKAPNYLGCAVRWRCIAPED